MLGHHSSSGAGQLLEPFGAQEAIMEFLEIAREQIRRDEGVRDRVYADTEGIPTVGVGHNLHKPLPAEVIDLLYAHDLGDAVEDARAVFPTFDTLTPARQAALVNMAFNLGRDRLAQFAMLRHAVAARDWLGAATEMLDSKWADDVGDRAKRLAKAMREG